MKAEDVFARLRAFPIAPFERLVPAGGLVVVAPHPDDESLGCGGLIAQARARGREVRIVVVSDGAGSHPQSRTHPPERLRDLRERETLAAAATLGVPAAGVTFLRLPDRFVSSMGEEALAASAAIQRVAEAAGAARLFTTSQLDPHCDHKASHALATHAARARGLTLWSYVIWGWTLPPGEETELDDVRGVRLDVSGELAAKREAVAQHASQLTDLIRDDPSGFRLSDSDVARCCAPYETFIEETP